MQRITVLCAVVMLIATLIACKQRAPTAGDLTVHCTSARPPQPLLLERALPIAADDASAFEPSALFLYNGELLAVSDKSDTIIYRLELGEHTASARTFLQFTKPAGLEGALDLEGLTMDREGRFLLASEALSRVLRVAQDGKAEMLPGDIKQLGATAGLFAKHNAGLEGVTCLDDGRLLLAAEREPRGLIELPASLGAATARSWAMPKATCPAPFGRANDFADLTTYDGRVFALQRNAHLVVRLERGTDGWLEREFWSYAHIENDPQYAYSDRSYGLAEGLAMDARHVFLVIDNNRNPRASTPHDKRPLLLVARIPD